MVDLHKSWI